MECLISYLQLAYLPQTFALSLKNTFTRSNVTWEEFLTKKLGLWIDTRSSTDNMLHGSGRAVGKNGILLQIEEIAQSNDGDFTCHVFSR